MEIEEYKKTIKELKIEFARKKLLAAIEYLEANTDIQIGDIVSDEHITIKVDRKEVYYLFSGIPVYKFYGPMIKKDGGFYKDKRRTVIFSPQIVKTAIIN